jgi:hypothetical protein
LAPGADHDPLARWLAERVRASIERPGPRRELAKMRGAVGLVADDVDSALTLRFDFGRLTIHEGLIGIPTITIRGATADLEALSSLSRAGSGVTAIGDTTRAAAQLVRALRSRRLKIYGLISHPRLLVRLFRVLADG